MFADHRSFRFHSGIDVPTNGKTGYPVLACQSGYVYRLFASWQGYGKAVYLRLDDGRYAVYGHLSDFSPSLSRIVTEAQVEAKRYKCDLFPKEGEIRVKKGEVIGYSGESGWGGTHLHFELRDSAGCPINPLTSGFLVKDELPPRIRSVAIRPLGEWARVNGSAKPVTFHVIRDPDGGYELPEAPLVEGEIGIELSAYDKMEDSRFTFGVYHLELRLDDSLVFSSKYDRFCFDNTHMIELDRDFEFRTKRNVSFYRLYLEAGNELPMYEPSGGRMSTENVQPGLHQAEIRAFDPSGNMSVLTFTLIFDRRPIILSCAWDEEEEQMALKVGFHDPDDEVSEIVAERRVLQNSAWEGVGRENVGTSDGESIVALADVVSESSLIRIAAIDGFGALSDHRYLFVELGGNANPNEEDSLQLDLEYDFRKNLLIVDLQLDRTLRTAPQLSLDSEGFRFDPLFLDRLDERSYRSVFPFHMTQLREPSLSIKGVSLYGDTLLLTRLIPIAIVTRTAGGTASSADGQAKAAFAPETVYEDMAVTIEPVETPQSRHAIFGKTYSFEPSTVPFDRRAKVSLKYPEAGCEPNRLGLYELTGEKSWRFLGQDLDTLERSVAAEVRYLSRYALLEDTEPPRIKRVSIPAGKRIRAKRPKITATLDDDLSGIVSDEQVVVEIDGEWMIPEYDPDKQLLVTRPVSPLSPGKHLLTIWVKDRAGNETDVEREFFIIGN